jgi:DNA-binding IclR family transcriptional regulator
MRSNVARKPKQDRQFVTALARGLDVLRAFGPGEALANREIAARTALPRPTISRLTYTLTRLGYLIQDVEAETYRPGNAVLSLGYTAVTGTDFRALVRPHMQKIADLTRSACALGQCHALEMLYVENCRGRNAPFTLGLEVGSRIPLATTAMGRAYLAGLAPAARKVVLKDLARQQGAGWKKVRAGLELALEGYERSGFALSIAEWSPEINAVAVPIAFPGIPDVMSLNCGGAASLLPEARLRSEVGPLLVQVKRQLEMPTS